MTRSTLKTSRLKQPLDRQPEEGGKAGGKGKKACAECGRGGYCPPGAAAMTLCAAGRYGEDAGQTSAESCKPTPAGSASSPGATAHTPCAAGTIAPDIGYEACEPCEAGRFQDAAGETGDGDRRRRR